MRIHRADEVDTSKMKHVMTVPLWMWQLIQHHTPWLTEDADELKRYAPLLEAITDKWRNWE